MSANGEASEMSDDEMVTLCAVADVSEDAPLRVEHGGADYAVYTKDGAFYVTADLCTHGPGFMSDGYQEGDEIECPFHQGRFSFITGEPTMPPCTEALRIWTTHVVDGDIRIDPHEVRKP